MIHVQRLHPAQMAKWVAANEGKVMTNEILQGKISCSKTEKASIDQSEGFTSLQIASLVSTNITEKL